jgi:acetyl esterase/lipase
MHARWITFTATMICIGLGVAANTFGRSPEEKPEAAASVIARALGAQRADEDMLRVLTAYASLRPRPYEKSDVTAARSNPTLADAVNVVLRLRARSTDPESRVLGVKSRESTVQGAEGMLPARIYSPSGEGPFPVVVYFHGGAWVMADRNDYDDGARGLAYYAKSVVVSVDYRLAPEHKFPAAWEDALAAYRWVVANASALNADPHRVALAGENSGGTLAVATAIAARDAGLVKPMHVLAIYPIAQSSMDTASYVENATALPMNRAALGWAFGQVTRTPEDLKDPRIQLIDANLTGLPPVTIISARIDPLRSDGEKLASALQKAGVAVERRDYEGTTHDFFGAAAVVEKAERAQSYAGQRLAAAFAN